MVLDILHGFRKTSALGVHNELGFLMLPFELGNPLGCDHDMDVAKSFPQSHIFPPRFHLNIASKIKIGDEKNFPVFRNVGNHLYGIG